ncbi:MAG: CerR family C-terminal domain-containing protein [Deltaproteobacteria bacterium]|nr:CerR family C-terminal domain-containing protein [Deltaproteobacteria bacterium]
MTEQAPPRVARRPGRPPQASSEETRARILDAALSSFARAGFAGARLKDIADGAGVHTALVHHYFGDKGNLYAAVLERALAPLKESGVTLLSPDLDVRMVMEGFVTLLVQFFNERRDIATLMARESLAGGEQLRLVMEETVRPLFQGALAFFGAARARGDVPDLDPAQMVFTVVGAVAVYFVHGSLVAQVTGEDPFTPEAVERRRTELVRMLHALLSPRVTP